MMDATNLTLRSMVDQKLELIASAQPHYATLVTLPLMVLPHNLNALIRR